MRVGNDYVIDALHQLECCSHLVGTLASCPHHEQSAGIRASEQFGAQATNRAGPDAGDVGTIQHAQGRTGHHVVHANETHQGGKTLGRIGAVPAHGLVSKHARTGKVPALDVEVADALLKHLEHGRPGVGLALRALTIDPLVGLDHASHVQELANVIRTQHPEVEHVTPLLSR